MAIYQRGNNWYIDFTFHGQRIREMIGPSRKGAQKVIDKRKAEIAENKFLDVRKDPEPITFHNFAKEYLQWAKTNKKPSSYQREISRMRALNNGFETKSIQAIITLDIERYKSKRKEDIKPASVNREIALLKHMFTKAIEWGKLTENPAKKVKLLKGEVKRVRFLMPDEIRSLLSNCADHLEPIVTVALHTGMRKGELLGLQWPQIDFEQGIITLTDTKNNERRDIPMNETVKDTLRGIERIGENVFCNGDGETFANVRRSFETALRKSGIENFRFHDLRHTFASTLVMAGEDLNTVRELLGHKDLTMTLRYAHLAPNLKKKAVNVLDRVMSLNPPHEQIDKKVVSLNVGNH
jgi:integrase